MKNSILLLIAMCCLGLTSYAQDKKKSKFERNINDVITVLTANNLIIDSLNREATRLNEEMKQQNAILARFSTRKFVRSNSEESLKRYLSNSAHASLKNLLANDKLKGELEGFRNLPLAQTYLKVVEINQSLHEVYDKARNNEYKTLIEPITAGLLEQHRADFKELASNVKDYRFVVFELARVFKIVDAMKITDAALAHSKLRENKETEYIEQIPCAEEAIKEYVSGSMDERLKIKKKWYKECPEAFPEIKSEIK